jgi:predicted MPP superfamily phosphohydrolase
MDSRRLQIGLDDALHIREERLSIRHDACRMLYVSDLHLRNGRSARLCQQVLDAANTSRPDVVLLGGDLVDLRSELDVLSQLVSRLRERTEVFAIAGNHDEHIGLDRVRDAIERGGGRWIHDEVAQVKHAGRVIAVSGPKTPPHAKGHVRILCAHNPRVWKVSRHAGYDLVLAGHLHGCQLVACEFRGRLFPGSFLYRYCFLRHRAGSTRLVVSRGVSDLLPIRWRCPREVVLCHV